MKIPHCKSTYLLFSIYVKALYVFYAAAAFISEGRNRPYLFSKAYRKRIADEDWCFGLWIAAHEGLLKARFSIAERLAFYLVRTPNIVSIMNIALKDMTEARTAFLLFPIYQSLHHFSLLEKAWLLASRFPIHKLLKVYKE